MRIAIIGSGVSGLVAAHHLHRAHDIRVFEASSWIGGHAHTVDVEVGDTPARVDTGFIVFNRRTYPTFLSLLENLGVAYQPSDMSFSVVHEPSGVEYAAAEHDPWALLARPRNAVDPGFWRMLRDTVRFLRSARDALGRTDETTTLGAYLDAADYSEEFVEWHLLPMAAAVWSSGTLGARDIPLHTLIHFFDNHGFLQLRGRPQWLTVSGGSRRYVEALTAPFRSRIALDTPVRALRRHATGVDVRTDAGTESFDEVVVATHSDQALALLEDPSPEEVETLSAIRYQPNDVVLHTDRRVMPKRRKSWASWNYHVGRHAEALPTVTYWMNLLQGLDTPEPLFVTLNRTDEIAPQKVLRRYTYDHPIFTHDAVRAQRSRDRIQGRRHTWYAGAYWRYGFHEDGARSGLDVAQALAQARAA